MYLDHKNEIKFSLLKSSCSLNMAIYTSHICICFMLLLAMEKSKELYVCWSYIPAKKQTKHLENPLQYMTV